MNNRDFIADLSGRLGYSWKDTERMTAVLVGVMVDVWQEGEAVDIDDFGRFEVKKKLERVTIQPDTRKRVLVPPELSLHFVPCTMLKNRMKPKEG